jgi:transposase
MAMHAARFGDYPIPEATVQVAQRAFPKGHLVMRIRDQFGMVYQNHQFAHLFASEGQPARAPAGRALITVMQYIAGVGDRQAADKVRDRISWKYALGLLLDDPGCDFSVLCAFRARLLTDDAETLLCATVLSLFRDAGLLKARGCALAPIRPTSWPRAGQGASATPDYRDCPQSGARHRVVGRGATGNDSHVRVCGSNGANILSRRLRRGSPAVISPIAPTISSQPVPARKPPITG